MAPRAKFYFCRNLLSVRVVRNTLNELQEGKLEQSTNKQSHLVFLTLVMSVYTAYNASIREQKCT